MAHVDIHFNHVRASHHQPHKWIQVSFKEMRLQPAYFGFIIMDYPSRSQIVVENRPRPKAIWILCVQNPKSFSESWSLFSMENDGNHHVVVCLNGVLTFSLLPLCFFELKITTLEEKRRMLIKIPDHGWLKFLVFWPKSWCIFHGSSSTSYLLTKFLGTK